MLFNYLSKSLCTQAAVTLSSHYCILHLQGILKKAIRDGKYLAYGRPNRPKPRNQTVGLEMTP